MRLRSLLIALACTAAACSTPATDAPPPGGPSAVASTAPSSPSPSASRSAPPSPAPSPSPTPVIGTFDGERALAFAVRLADDVGPRPAGSEGDAQGQVLIAQAFREAGWAFVTQQVPLPQGGATQNIIAFQGEAPPDGPYVVLGGHHDTIGGPGANDNATGIGVLVALAEELADEELAVPVVLIAYGAEEFQPGTREHHIGSAFHAEAEGDRVLGALMIDMVGNGDRHCICWLDLGPATMAERVAAVAESRGVRDRFYVEARGDISDHGPYARRGIPAAFLWSGRDGRLHTSADTSEHLRLDDIQRAGELALAFVRALTDQDLDGLDAA